MTLNLLTVKSTLKQSLLQKQTSHYIVKLTTILHGILDPGSNYIFKVNKRNTSAIC